MDPKEKNTEEIQSKVQKSDWNEPVIFILDYKITKSGGPYDQTEDFEAGEIDGATS